MRRILGAAIFFLVVHSSWVVKKLRSEDLGGGRDWVVKMHTTMHSPKMTRSLQQISDKFGGSLPSVNKIPNKLQLGDKLHTVQVKVGQSQYLSLGRKLLVWWGVMGDWERSWEGWDEVTSQDGHHNYQSNAFISLPDCKYIISSNYCCYCI